ncbi:MAG TPA: hypothetical protein PK165_01635 [bacterium]|nr:hypothetical protein [bacterium]HOL50053.1 hypothetical protein [bacterium]HPO51516.1 hypothetical protein [bacterium]
MLANFLPEPVRARNVEFKQTGSNKCLIYKVFEQPVETKFPVSLSVNGERVVFIVEG